MMVDKGYYDYDYEAPSEKWRAYKSAAKSDEELTAVLLKMGLKPSKKKAEVKSAEQIQQEVMTSENLI